MRWRPCRRKEEKPAAPRPETKAVASVPLPDNPYRRFYTRTPTFEELVRRARREDPSPKK